MQEKQTGAVEVDNGSGLDLAPDPTPEKDLASIVPGQSSGVKLDQAHFLKTLFGSAQGYLFVGSESGPPASMIMP